jgi:hypothetical protein
MMRHPEDVYLHSESTLGRCSKPPILNDTANSPSNVFSAIGLQASRAASPHAESPRLAKAESSRESIKRQVTVVDVSIQSTCSQGWRL